MICANLLPCGMTWFISSGNKERKALAADAAHVLDLGEELDATQRAELARFQQAGGEGELDRDGWRGDRNDDAVSRSLGSREGRA